MNDKKILIGILMGSLVILIVGAYLLGKSENNTPPTVLSVFYKKMTNRIAVDRKKIYGSLSYIGAGVFILSGLLIITLNFMDKIQMYQTQGYSNAIRLFVYQISKYFQNPIVDILTFSLIVFIFYKLIRHYS